MNYWLRAAGSNINECLLKLQLSPTDCGRFHIRGSCNSRNCRLAHEPRVHNAAHVAEVVGLLTAGLNQAQAR